MKAFSYIKDIIDFPFTIGEEIGWGAQGQVFQIVEDPNRVIKFSSLFDREVGKNIESIFTKIMEIHSWIKNNPHESIVSIFEFGELLRTSRKTVDGDQKFIVYYSIQEKLQELSISEKKVFKIVCDYYDGDLTFDGPIELLLREKAPGYDVDYEKVCKFYTSVLNYPIDNYDFRIRNIMKDSSGFKLIDFELSEIKEK